MIRRLLRRAAAWLHVSPDAARRAMSARAGWGAGYEHGKGHDDD